MQAEETPIESSERNDSDPDSSDEDEDDYADFDETKFAAPRQKTRRPTVMSSVAPTSDDWVPPVYDKSDEEAEMLRIRLKSNVLTKHLEEEAVTILVNAFQVVHFTPDDIIIQQGAEGDRFYVVEEGNCVCSIEGVGAVKTIDGGTGADSFGELALLYNAPRAATVTAISVVKAWALDRISFKQILQNVATKQTATYTQFISEVEIFSTLSSTEKQHVTGALKPKMYAAGDVVIEEGDDGNEFFIIQKGAVLCYKGGVVVSDPLTSGSYFGELALLHDEKRAARVVATEPTTCLTVDRDTFKRVLGPLTDILHRNKEVYQKYISESS